MSSMGHRKNTLRSDTKLMELPMPISKIIPLDLCCVVVVVVVFFS